MPSLFSRFFDVPSGPDLPGVTVPASGVTDHGELTGLSDDDHSQYLLTDGTRRLTGAFLPDTMADTSAPNDSVFIDSGTGLLYFKDSGGALYDLTEGSTIAPPP